MSQDEFSQLAIGFQQAWAHPTPAKLAALIHRDTILFQPHLPPIKGRNNAIHEFHLFLEWLPDFRGKVNGHVGNGNLLFIDWTMCFPLGRKTVPIRAVDKIIVHDGLVFERAVYFNTLPIIKQILRTPNIWPGYLKYRTAARNQTP